MSALASFDEYEVRLNRRGSLVFITSTVSGSARVLSAAAAVDPATEVRLGITIPAEVRDAIRTAITWDPCGAPMAHGPHDRCPGRAS